MIMQVGGRNTFEVYGRCDGCGMQARATVQNEINRIFVSGKCPKCGSNRVTVELGCDSPPAWWVPGASITALKEPNS